MSCPILYRVGWRHRLSRWLSLDKGLIDSKQFYKDLPHIFGYCLYNEPTISGFFRYLHVKDAATNSVSLGVSTSTPSNSDLAITAIPPWALFNLSGVFQQQTCSFLEGLPSQVFLSFYIYCISCRHQLIEDYLGTAPLVL